MRPLRLLALVGLLSAFAAAQVTFTSASYPVTANGVRVAQLNGDGAPDLFFLNTSGQQLTDNVQLNAMLNDGHGAFATPLVTRTDLNTGSAELADMNRDGNIDAVLCGGIYMGTVNFQFQYEYHLEVWLGNGGGTFTKASDQKVGSCNNDFSVADFTGDGMKDVALVYDAARPNSSGDNRVQIFKGDGTGGFSGMTETSLTVASGYSGPYSYVGSIAADFNGDGKADLFLVGDNSIDYTDTGNALGYGDGTGHFTVKTITTENGGGAMNTALRIGDVNQDGSLDVLGTWSFSCPHGCGGADIAFDLNNGSGFNASTLPGDPRFNNGYSNEYDQQAVAVDLDGDGIKDVALSHNMYDDAGMVPDIHSLAVGIGNGSGYNFNYSFLPTSDYMSEVVAGDFDRDGRMDLAYTSAGSNLTVLLNRTSTAPQCAAKSTLRSVALCLPASSTSPVHVLANTNDSRAINAMKIYVDGVAKFKTPDELVNTNLNLSAGTHKITAKVWDDLGSFSSSASITVGSSTTSTCSNTTNRTVKICAPASGATVNSPVQVTATVADTASVSAVKVYLDGTSVYSTTSKNVSTTLPISAGSHHITVKAWDSAGSFSSAVSFTVQ